MKTIFKKPKIIFNPVPIVDLKMNETTTQLNLKIVGRYCDMNKSLKTISFFLELSNGRNNFYIPCKYYEFICCAQTEDVVCNIIKVIAGNSNLSVIELASFNKPELRSEKVVDKPLGLDNSILQEGYLKFNVAEPDVGLARIINNQETISCSYAIGRGQKLLCSLKALKSKEILRIAYRELLIEKEIWQTDMEAIV